MLKVITNSQKDTMNLGTRLVRFLGPGDIVCLFGSLGAGKTVLVKGMAGGLDIDKDEIISPSFVLIREYLSATTSALINRHIAAKHKRKKKKAKIGITLYHVDLFRLRNPGDIFNLGFEEYLYAQGICVIEWAQRLGGFLPSEFLKIELQFKNRTKRIIKFISKGKRYHKVIERFSNFIVRNRASRRRL